MKSIILVLLFAGAALATVLPWQNNLNNEDPTCWALRTNGEENVPGCKELKRIGQTYADGFATFRARPDLGAIECRYAKIEHQCRAFLMFDETDHLFTRFTVTYGANFDFGPGMKIMRWNGGATNDHILFITNGASNPAGNNGINEMSQICAERNGGSGLNYGCWSGRFVRGRPYEITNEILLNTAGQANGIFRMWIDGVLVINSTGLANMRVSGTAGLYLTSFGGWYSGATPADTSGYLLDNLAVSLTAAGLAGEPAPGGPPPVVIAWADTTYTITRDTTRYQVIRVDSVRTIRIPTVASVDTTIHRDTMEVE